MIYESTHEKFVVVAAKGPKDQPCGVVLDDHSRVCACVWAILGPDEGLKESDAQPGEEVLVMDSGKRVLIERQNPTEFETYLAQQGRAGKVFRLWSESLGGNYEPASAMPEEVVTKVRQHIGTVDAITDIIPLKPPEQAIE